MAVTVVVVVLARVLVMDTVVAKGAVVAGVAMTVVTVAVMVSASGLYHFNISKRKFHLLHVIH